jgi:hypothetical protein
MARERAAREASGLRWLRDLIGLKRRREAGRSARRSCTEPLRVLPVLPAMEEERQLRADIAGYRRTLRIVFDPDVKRRIEEMIKMAEDRLREIERLP